MLMAATFTQDYFKKAVTHLESPWVKIVHENCLSFRYISYMEFNVSQIEWNETKVIFKTSSVSTFEWRNVELRIPPGEFYIRFSSVHLAAVDQIKFHLGDCSSLAGN